MAILAGISGASAAGSEKPGDFDYYVLALSWSPTYCASSGRNADPMQCRASKPYGFIVHGLWPQYERGWPDFCHMTRYQRPSKRDIDGILQIMPSRGLANHQWKKHGTCSGLSPGDYFDLTREAFERVKIPAPFKDVKRGGNVEPDAVEKAFRLANPGLRNNAMAVTCNKGQLKEVRLCLDRDLNFRSCRAVDRAGCRSKKIHVLAPGS